MVHRSIHPARRSSAETTAAAGALALALLLGASPAFPAHPVFDARGFDPEREFLSELPYEHVDPMTGNLLLTFTDLVLPGNAGFDLRIQRTYNSKIYENYTSGGWVGFREDSWAGIGWSLHFGRVSRFPGLPTLPGPVIEMPDGSQHQAYRHKDGVFGHYITRDYWTFEDRSPAPILRLPNGLVYTFGRVVNGPRPTEVTHYVTEIRDPFGNTLTVNYAPAPAPADVVASVVQRIGTRTRTVTFAYDPTLSGVATGSLRSMTFEGRTWTYRQKRVPFFTYSALSEVVPPLGPSWKFEYSESPADVVSGWLLSRLTTPSGGRIDYGYTPQLFRIGSGVIYTPSLQTRTASGTNVATGTWRYEYSSPDWRDPIQSSVTTPCGSSVRHTFKPIGSYGAEEPWAIGSMISKEVWDGAQLLERQSLTWTRSSPVSDFPESGNSFQTHVPLLGTRTVMRSGGSASYRTQNFYSPLPYSRSRAANFNDHGRPFLIMETGELDRATVRAFGYLSGSDPSFGSYIVDRVAAELLVSGPEVFGRSFEYVPATGFMRLENRSGIVTRFESDAWGNVASTRDANDNATGFTHDWGVVKNTATPEFTITREINSDGTVKTETRRGHTTRFQYDEIGRPTLVAPPIGLETRTQYDNFAGRFTRVSRGSSVTTTSLNGFGQIVRTENGLRVAATRDYDSCGRPVYEGYPFYAGSAGSPSIDTGTTTAFDALGRVVRRTHPDSSFQAFQHRGIDVTITDEIGRQTVQDRSAFGSPDDARLVAVTDADAKTTRYSYNALGSLTRVEGPGGTPVRSWAYNTRGELVSETHPEAGSVTFSYDPAGNLRTRRDEQFGVSTFDYDRNDRLVSIDRPGAAYDTGFGWDASDNRTLAANGQVNSRFQYDAVNRLQLRTDVIGTRSFITSYAYDDTSAGNGNLKTLGYPTGRSVTYAYDSEGRISSLRSGAKLLAASFKYHASGGVASFQRGNGIAEKVEYDARHRPFDLESGSVLNLRSVYDDVGNVERVDDSRAGMDLSFTYDPLDRLLTANGPWGPGRFSYDARGNRETRSIGAASTSYGYDAATQRLVSATGADAGSFAYDRNGNLQKDARGSYTHAPTNLMETATVSSQVSSYRYDADDLRKLRVAAGETHYYVHGPAFSLLSELLEKGAFVEPVRDYVYAGSRLIAAIKPSPLVVTPTALDFTALAGGTPSPGKKVKIETLGATGLAFTATSSAAWLTLSATSGATPHQLSVAVNPAGLAAGSYTGTVTIVAPLAQGSPKTVAVSVLVVAQPELQVTPGSLSFEATAPASAAALAPPAPGAAASARSAEALLRIPLVFERNQGQADPSVEFLARGPGYALFLTREAVVLGLAPGSDTATGRVRMRFVDANREPRVVAREERPGRSHYYRGDDPSRWVTGARQFGRVAYEQVYPGIDAVFYGNQRQLEYDLVVAPGASPDRVRLAFEGAQALRIDDDGDLVLEVAGGELVQKKPIVYQEAGGTRQPIVGRYRLTGESTVAFEVGEYDHDQPLVIDPVLSYFTYLGGSQGGDESCTRHGRCGRDWLFNVVVDASGSAYVAGHTLSTDFPLAGAGEDTAAAGGRDLVVAKLDPLGSSLSYATYLGGSMNEWGGYLALAPGGKLFLAGGTRSPDFPTTADAMQRFFAGPFEVDPDGQDVVVVELGADGELLFSTYYGGRGMEWADGIGVDGAGAAYVGGATWSDNLPMRNAMQPTLRGSHDAFVAKIVPSGDPTRSSLVWSTYFGGSGSDFARAFTTDTAGNSYLAGHTQSTDLPLNGAIQGSLNAGAPVPTPPQYPFSDAFVTKIDPSGTSVLFSTYLGGTDEDWASGLALGPGNAIHVTGSTLSTDFPLHRPLQPYLNGGEPQGYGYTYDGFAAAIQEGQGLVYSTFLGTFPYSPRVDSLGNLYFLHSAQDLVVHPFRSGQRGTGLAKIAPDGSRYLFASPIADGIGLAANGLALDGGGNVFLVGSTWTPDLATPGAFKTSVGGEFDGYLMKLTGTGGAGGGSSFLQQALLIKDRVLASGPFWTASESIPWLQLSRTSGTGPAIVFADVDTTGLLPGVYAGAITVSASGALGSPKDVPVTLTIRPGAPQPAQANPGGPYRGQLIPDVELDGSASVDPAGTIAFHLWSFDDGATALGKKVKHLFTTPGNHAVTLTIRGFSGASASATTSVYINHPVELRISGPYTGVVDQPIAFDGSASFDPDGTVVAYQWTFGDGATGVGPSFPHAYSQPGTYTVTLAAQDDTGYWSYATTTATISIASNEPPVARPGGPYLGEPGVSVTLDGRASTDSDGSIASWAWDFGDQATGAGAVVSHAYADAGVYDVTLTVTDNLGAQATAATQVTVGMFSVTPDRLRFRMFAGGANPKSQPLELSFPSPLAWTATASEPWLAIDATGGTTPGTLTVSVDAGGLDAGTRQGTVTITPAGVGARPVLVPIELVVEPPAGTCDAAAYFCEPFDELLLDNLAGQNGWAATPDATTSNQVVPDPRPGPGAKVLLLDPASGLTGIERVEFSARPLADLEVALEVTSAGVGAGSLPASVDLLGPAGGGGWGVESRAFGSLWIGSALVFRDGEFTNQTLLDTVEPGRWYGVRLVYRAGEVEGWVDGVQRFRAPMNAVASEISGLAVTGGDAAGSVSLDLIQVKPFVPPPLEGELVAEPAAFSFQHTVQIAQVGLAQPAVEAARVASGSRPAELPRDVPARPSPAPTLPLEFEANVGQADPAVRFLARGRGYGLFVTPAEMVLALPGHGTPLRVRFEGAQREAELRGLDVRPGKSHYLIGRDPAGWYRNVPRYARVEARELYPGVSAVFYGNEGRLEYDLVVSPGADPGVVRLAFDGVEGMRIDDRGDLVLATRAGEVRHQRPLVYQLLNGERRPVEASYSLLGDRRVAFRLGAFDDSLSLTIDPTLVYSTFLGGIADDGAQALAIDLAGHAYLGGYTASANFPVTAGSYQPVPAGNHDAFVTKLDLAGTGVVYSTYVGGKNLDFVEALAVDADGHVYAGGRTYSDDFPLANALQSTPGGQADGFLLRLDPSGASLAFSTYLGGWRDDSVADLAIGPDGRVSLTGQASNGFPLTGYWSHLNNLAAFAARFDSRGVRAFAVGLGETDTAYTVGQGVATDAAGNTWVTGWTTSTRLPMVGAVQPAPGGGGGDAFLARFSPSGSLLYSSYLGGSGFEAGHAIAVDASGNVVVTGATASPDFPVRNPARSFHGGTVGSSDSDGFVTKLDPTGASLVFSTFLGEPYAAWGQAIATDSAGSIHVGGRTDLTAQLDGDTQALLTRLSPDGSTLEPPTTLGGSGFDEITDIEIDATADLWAAGQTSSPDFPAVGSSYQALPGGGYDAFLLRYSSGPANPVGILQLANGYGAHERAGAATISIGRIGGSLGEVTVDYSTGPGTALTPWDYSPVSGTLVLPDGATTGSFSVPVFHNQVHLGDTTFTVSLANPTGGATLGRSSAPVTILEADASHTGLSARFRVRDRSRPTGPAWTAFVDVPWLTLSAYSGTGPSVVTITASPSGLGDGTHSGSITISANALGSPLVIPVTLTILCTEGC